MKHLINSCQLLIVALLLIASTPCVYADDEEVDPGQITFRSPIAEIQNEKIDPYTGELSLAYTDLTFPGNGGLDLSIVRTYKSNRKLSFIPPLGQRWEIHMGRLKINGNQITIELNDGTLNTAVKLNSASFTFKTKDFWKVDLNNGKIVQLPDGTTIQYDHQGPEDGWWYATKISKNGYQIDIMYKSFTQEIQSITDSIGRQIKFTYALIANRSRLTSIHCVNDTNINVQYRYLDNDNKPPVLYQVVFPENETWTYTHNGLLQRLNSVITPYDGTIAYAYDYYYRTSGATSVRPQISVNVKTISGSHLPNNAVWTFNYKTEEDRDISTIIDPCSRITKYWFFGYTGITLETCYRYSLQEKMEIRDATNNIEYSEQNIWGKIDNPLSSIPYWVYNYYDSMTYIPVLLKQTVTTLGGDTYTTEYRDYDNYGNPGTKIETGSATKTTDFTYWYDVDDNIVKNKPKTITIQGNTTFPGTFAMAFEYEQNTGNPVLEDKFGIITKKTYTPEGNLLTSTDGNNKTTTYEWENGAISSITNPIYTIKREINWNGTVASETDGRACDECTTRYEYDGAMRLTQKTPPKGNPILYTYQFGANAFSRQTRGGFSTTTSYDGLGRETKTIESIGNGTTGNQTNTFFKDCGLKDRTLSTTGDTQRFDNLGRLLQVQHHDSTKIDYTNHSDRHVTVTDEAGNTSELYYDSFADPSEKYLHTVTDALTKNAAYRYNVLGSLTSASYEGLTYRYLYNSANLLEQETRPDGSVAIYTHDAAGNVLTKDDNLPTKTFHYDDINRLTSVTVEGATLEYEYDNADNLITLTSPHGVVSSTFDGANRLTGSIVTTLDRSGTLDYDYDNNDNLTKITFPSGMQLSYTYNAWNQVTGITGFGGAVTGITYYPSGPQLGLMKGYAFSNGQSTTLTSNSRRALTSTVSDASKLGFAYDEERGNLAAVTNTIESSKNATFTYDKLSRLQTYTSTNSWGAGRFEYFNNGNRYRKILGTSLTYSYANGDRLTNATYNGDGDMTSMNGLIFDYNPFHHLHQIRQQQNGAVLAQYGYDANGLRIFKAGGETKIYLNGPDGNVLSELDGSGKTLADYVYLNGTLVARVGEPDHNPVLAPWLLLLLNDNE